MGNSKDNMIKKYISDKLKGIDITRDELIELGNELKEISKKKALLPN